MTPSLSDLFLQEARKLARLRHPGIVTVHDVGVHEGLAYIISDYLEGPSLADWLKQTRPSWPEAARIAADVADALAHAHARLTVHRDVKPANIVLTADGAPVLVDFGLALDDGQAGGGEFGIISGTPMYMSPEQFAGQAHRIDGRTDIYSLGVVLYEMLAGCVPFRSSNTVELLRQVQHDEPQPPRQLVRDIPPELERICVKALAKRQQDRYTTASDFADELRSVIQTASGLAPARQSVPPSATLSAPPSVRQQPVVISFDERSSATSSSARTQGPMTSSSSTRRQAREAERRQVTVLACGCDLFESQAYLENLDAEDQAQVLHAFRQACEQAVTRFDGTVVQCNEQGLLACFGYPVAYEDAARRAARTGLALKEDLTILGEQLLHRQKLELHPWVGIHTGPAVVEMAQDSISLVGEARNVAVRLEDVGERGQIVCSETTHRLIQGHFECAHLGPRKIKGVALPVDLFRIERIAQAVSPLEAAGPTGLTPLIGRDHEIGLLQDRWEQAQEGMGQIVFLSGEPGLGKSRLVYWMRQHAQGTAGESGPVLKSQPPSPGSLAPQSSATIEWRCSPHFRNTGLHPVSDFFQRFLAFERDEAPAAHLERLVGHLDEYGLARSEIVPMFQSLLSLPRDERFPPLGLSPVREREETFRALREWLHAYSERTPVLFIVEDLHWADASTLEFLGQFFTEGLYDRILTLVTFRPEFRPPWPAVTNQTTLALNRLTRRQVGELMGKKIGTAPPDGLVAQLYDRTDGVPLFVEEFTKMVQESGVLDGDAHGEILLTREIPATLQDLVMVRLDRMEGNWEMAQLAAALGREFSYELLLAVAEMDAPALQAELDKLVQAEILYRKGRPPQCNYIFKHALLEDAAYKTLVKGKRLQFQQRVTRVLEEKFPQTVEAQPELLAHHATEAGLDEKAIGYWLKAGLRSQERSANVEAIGHLSKGLELLGALAESPERDAMELKLLSPLGAVYLAVRGYAAPEVGPVFQRARELCERIGQPSQLFAILLGNWEWNIVRGQLRLCMNLAAEGMKFARQLNDPGMVMEALFMSAETKLYRAEFVDASADFATAVNEYDDRERTRAWATYTSHNAGVTCRSNLAVCLWHQGYPDQALKINREMCELARAIQHPFSLAYAMHHTAWLCQQCRMGSETRAAAEEGTAIANQQGFALWQATGAFFIGAGMALQGELEKGLQLLRKGVDAFRASGAELTLPFQLCTLGAAYLQAGRFEDAGQALDEGLAIAEKNDERFAEAELHRQKGELLLASFDKAAAAEDCFRQAIETARRQQSKAWELRAAMSLARLWQRQGRRDEARSLLAPIHGAYTEGFTTPDLADAGAILESLA